MRASARAGRVRRPARGRARGFRLRARRDPRVVETFDGDVALARRQHAARARRVEPDRPRARGAARGRRYRADEAAALVTEVLPALRERIPLEIATRRLAARERRAAAHRVRRARATERQGDALSVLAAARLRRSAERAHRRGPARAAGRGAPAARRGRRARAAAAARAGARARARAARASRPATEALAARAIGCAAGPTPRVARRARALHARRRARAALRARRGAAFELHFDARRPRRAARPTARVLRAWRAGESWVALEGGGFAELPRRLARALRPARRRSARGARRARRAAARARCRSSAALCEELGEPARRRRRAAAALGAGRRAAPAARRGRCPPTSRAELRGYQRRRRRWLALPARRRARRAARRRHGPRQDAAGALRAARPHAGRGADQRAVPNWAARDRALPPGPARLRLPRRRAARSIRSADVTLTSYALLRLDAEALAAADWDTRRARRGAGDQEPGQPGRARRVSRCAAASALALTGTPVENRLDELWSQFHFLNRGLLGGRRDFDERYARPIAAGDAGAAAAPARAHPAVRAAPPEARGRAGAAAAHRDACCTCELDDDERAVYDAVRAATRDEVVAQLARGRQRARGARGAAAPAPGRLPPAPRARARRRERSSKLERAARDARGGGRRGPQGAGLLAVDVAARSRRAAPARGGHRLRAPRRLHARPRRRRRALPGARAARR